MTDRTTGWPPKRRKEYSERMKKARIWQSSTGPRTAEGKAVASKNRLSHGTYAGVWLLVREALRAQRQLICKLKQVLKILSIRRIRTKSKHFFIENARKPYRIARAPRFYAPNICGGYIGTFFGNPPSPYEP
jgi:hypothetical protein